MNYKKIILAFSFAILFVSAGCDEKDEVDYLGEGQNTVDSTIMIAQENSEDKATLRAKLGIEEGDKYENVISSENGEVKISSTIELPNTDKLYTLNVKERYLTNEDKKNILTCLFDEESISVDMARTATKESVEKLIEKYQYLYKGEEKGQEFNEYMEYLSELKSKLPSEKDLMQTKKDYSGTDYLVEKAGETYVFCFYADPFINESGFAMIDEDHVQKDIPKEDKENQSSLSPEEAADMAKKLCVELGFSDMDVFSVDERKCSGLDANEKGEEYLKYWYDGYNVRLIRSIAGVPVDYQQYKNETDNDNDILKQDYSFECIDIGINDSGLCSIEAKGLMKDAQISNEVKLISFDKVCEVLMDEISSGNWYVPYISSIKLLYIRIKGEDNDSYCYIPAWRIGTHSLYSDTPYDIDEFLFINAMDGTVIQRDDLENVI